MNGLNVSLISIIVPVYNIENYLDRCLKSLLEQTYKNIEIILVDDGSTDGSSEVCNHYREIDKRVVVIHQKNGGVSKARNAGIMAAKGEYIMFVDGDDFVNNQIVEMLYRTVTEKKVKFAFCDLVVRTLSGEEKRCDIPSCVYDKKFINENFFFDNNMKELLWGPYQKLFNADLIKDIRFSNYALGEDMLFVYRVIQQVDSIAYVNYLGYYYVHREGSAAKSNFSLKNFDYLYAVYDIAKICKEKAPYAYSVCQDWVFYNSLIIFRAIIVNGYKNNCSNEYSGLLFISSSCLVLGSKIIANLLFAKDFFVAWKITPILVLAYVYSALAQYLNSIFSASKQTKALLYSSLAGAIVNILLNVLLIPEFQGTGAAIATVSGYMVIWIVNMIVNLNFLKKMNNTFFELLHRHFYFEMSVFNL